jgi:uncharacterized protein with NAD-binding domain and iron-sulfur cluster
MKTDPSREGEKMHGLTGIFVRAVGRNGRRGTYDIAELDAESFTDWLQSEGGSNPLAENTLRVLLGYDQVVPAT